MMRAASCVAPPRAASAGEGSWVARSLRLFLRRTRSPDFWLVQAGVAAITVAHYSLGMFASHAMVFDNLHHVAVMLYVFPIMYAGLRYRLEGGILTALWCGVLTVPNVALWHRHNFDWAMEMTHASIGLSAGIVVSWLVDKEARQRERAEDMAARLRITNRQIIQAQEEERHRIARELHDDTIQRLLLLRHKVDSILAKERGGRERSEPLRELRDMSASIVSEVRRFSRDLRPSVLDDLGLVMAVKWLIFELQERQSIGVRLELVGTERRLTRETELAFFRIIQEALRNVESHAEADDVVVELSFTNGAVEARVLDNGRGFAPANVMGNGSTKGLGLIGMRERAELAGASLNIASKPGEGTEVTVALAG